MMISCIDLTMLTSCIIEKLSKMLRNTVVKVLVSTANFIVFAEVFKLSSTAGSKILGVFKVIWNSSVPLIPVIGFYVFLLINTDGSRTLKVIWSKVRPDETTFGFWNWKLKFILSSVWLFTSTVKSRDSSCLKLSLADWVYNTLLGVGSTNRPVNTSSVMSDWIKNSNTF